MAIPKKSSPVQPLPLQDVYDTLRTARMNERYYGERLAWLQQWNLALEILTTLGMSGAVASLAL